jgi:hypothetical protein
MNTSMNVRTFSVQEQIPTPVKYPHQETQNVQTSTDPVKELEANSKTNVETPYTNLQPNTREYVELFELRNENNMYKQLMSLLKSSYKIPDKLLDERKKIIIPKTVLRRFIASMLHISSDKVFIVSIIEAGCLCSDKIEYITEIKIKVGERCYRSLEIFYNEIYNRIVEEFSISLSKVIGV